ncbi:MAG: hypothetical protein JWN70_6847 [Planctomycetaceae bacterium]|nr:hypothetical protein [Planctomycetaceae bacterium]
MTAYGCRSTEDCWSVGVALFSSHARQSVRHRRGIPRSGERGYGTN